MKRVNRRPERVAAAIKNTLASSIITRVKDPRVGFATITAVSVTNDLSLARVKISVIGGEEERNNALKGLDSARGFLRSIIAGQLDLKSAPELRFEIDRSVEFANRIDELLADDRERES